MLKRINSALEGEKKQLQLRYFCAQMFQWTQENNIPKQLITKAIIALTETKILQDMEEFEPLQSLLPGYLAYILIFLRSSFIWESPLKMANRRLNATFCNINVYDTNENGLTFTFGFEYNRLNTRRETRGLPNIEHYSRYYLGNGWQYLTNII